MLIIQSGYTGSLFDLSWLGKLRTLFANIGKMFYSPDESSGADGNLRIAYVEDPWMTQFRNGDAETFEKVFKEYYPSMVYYAKSFLHEKDAARDIAQDALAKLWEIRAVMQNPQNIKAFLYVTTRNACLNCLRHNKVVQETMNKLPGFYEKSTTEIEDISILNTEIVSVEVVQLITNALATMPEKYQQIIRLLYFENRSLQDVSSLLQIPYQTASTHKIRALKLLKTALRDSSRFSIFLYIELAHLRQPF